MTARRSRTRFVCASCGAATPKWAGRCPECGEWNSMVEEVVERGAPARSAAAAPVAPLSDVSAADAARVPTGTPELDRLLGGGIVPGGLYLVGGEPGIGKSTLLLQMAGALAARGSRVLILAGEESPAQIKLRAERLGVASEGVLVAAGTALDALIGACERVEPDIVILDSIQTAYDPALSSAPGSVSQVRAAAAEFQRWCKARGAAAFLVGHVTKGGGLAGPKTLEHAVDAVLQFEGDPHHDYRVLRARKNRFGSTHEIAVFTMGERGMEAVENPSAFFLDRTRRDRPVAGSAHVASLEGTRPLLIEIQALVAESPYGTPQRVSGGFDGRRLALLLAVLDRRAGLRLGSSDVFLNVVGGLSLTEPAADLGVVVALASSRADRPLKAGTVVFGEVGLTGEVRPVRLAGARLREAARLGFTRAVVAAGSDRGGDDRPAHDAGNGAGLRVDEVDTVAGAVALALEDAG
ncbi:MAG TPA: DNA repair protein RadA [Gemmatimonadota bacterium]|nr:DNA repair protein RadA [Gemmatimonadota bacterium]